MVSGVHSSLRPRSAPCAACARTLRSQCSHPVRFGRSVRVANGGLVQHSFSDGKILLGRVGWNCDNCRALFEARVACDNKMLPVAPYTAHRAGNADATIQRQNEAHARRPPAAAATTAEHGSEARGANLTIRRVYPRALCRGHCGVAGRGRRTQFCAPHSR